LLRDLYVDLYYLSENAPTSLDLHYLAAPTSSETDRASVQSGTTSTSTSVRRRFSFPSLFRKPRDEAVPPGSRLVVVKHAKTSTTLALRDVAPSERVEVPMPASVAVKLYAEAVLLASLTHDNVVACLGMTEVVAPSTKLKTFGIVQEFANGGTLLHQINERNFSNDQAYGWMVDMARGMAYLHTAASRQLAHATRRGPEYRK
jgi:serine/threonine protein kinase